MSVEEPDGFFSSAIANLQRALRIKAHQQSAPRAPRLNIAELQDAVRRGVRARELMQSSAWKEDLLPFLDAEAKRCQMPPWKPGDDPSPVAVDSVHKFNSGSLRAYQRILDEVLRWAAAGEEAAATLGAEQARADAATKAAA